MELNKIYNEDCLSGLRKLPSESVDCVFTSPPYWALRDYGDSVQSVWDGDSSCQHEWGEKINKKVSTNFNEGFNERCGQSAGQRKQEEAKPKDICQGNFCVKCGAWRGQLGLEPTFQLYIKHLCDIFDEVKRVLKPEGNCWVNLGDTYGTVSGGSKQLTTGNKKQYGQINHDNRFGTMQEKPKKMHKCLVQIPSRFAIEMTNRGWILRNEIIWYKRNCMPSSVKDRFTVDFEKVFLFSKNQKYFFNQIRVPHNPDSIKRACRARVSQKLDAKQYQHSRKNDYTGYENMQERFESGELSHAVHPQGRNMRCVWDITPKPFKEAHFAVFPEELAERVIKAGCPGGGVVLDPFFGSGTVGVASLKQGKKFVGFELNPEYIKIAEARLKPHLSQKKLEGFA